MKKKILYISTNDGSDMRINKEIRTLSKYANVFFLGVGMYGEKNYAKDSCSEFHLIQEKRNSAKAIINQIALFKKLIKNNDFDSLHIINEQLMIFFYPWLFKEHVVLDIFDSFFLKKNFPKNKLALIKKLVYSPISHVLVTDENRKELMPNFLRNKIIILENYPFKYIGSVKKKTEKLTILYNGSMSNARGTKFLNDLSKVSKEFKVIMAGWITDEDTLKLSKQSFVDFKGVLTQTEALEIAATQTDYIMCCYEPTNQNNINASPNKIYDAIQTKTPVIINNEVKVSAFVKNNDLGIVLNSFYDYNAEAVYNELIQKKGQFKFSDEAKENYSWESIENKLIKAHNLIN